MSDVVAVQQPLAAARMQGVGARLRAVFAEPAVRRSLPLVVATIVATVAVLAFVLMRSPEQRTLFPGVGEEDKAAIVDALDAAGVEVAIESASGQLSVAADDYHRARMMLAAQGLPKGAASGSDLLSELPLGSSRAVEQARLRQSQEIDLARSIATMAGIDSAQVHLALPEPSVFLRDQTPPSASVFLKLATGRSFGQPQVRSIVNLVASSVSGLSPDRVSVVDQSGSLLTADGSGGGESMRRLDLQAQLERGYRERLAALLTPLLGPGNFTAEVHLDLDFSETQATREMFDKDGAVLRSETGSLSGAGVPPLPSGIPGALSNQPPAAAPPPAAAATPAPAPAAGAPLATLPAPAAAGGDQSYTRNFEIGRAVEVTKTPVGRVERVSTAVVLRAATGRNRPDLKTVEAVVKSAVGFNQTRGDVVTVTASAFTAPVAPDEPIWWEQPWVRGQATNLAALLVVALVVLGVIRPFLRRVASAAPAPAPPSALTAEEMQALEALRDRHRTRAPVPIELLSTANSYDDKVAVMRTLVAGDTARASNVVRQLMRAPGTPARAD